MNTPATSTHAATADAAPAGPTGQATQVPPNAPPTAPQGGNADPGELAKFSDMAAAWWDLEGGMKPLHQLNPYRLGWIDAHIGLSGKTMVDVGCGGGILSESMARQGAQVLGVDLALKALRVAQMHAVEAGISTVQYRHVAVEALAAELGAVHDGVTCMEMLEHVPDPAAIVQACADLTRPGGMVFFSTISRNFKAFMLAIVGAEHITGLVPKGTHEYAKFIRPAELAAWGRAAGLELIDAKGLEYNPLTRQFRITGDTSVNYMQAWRKPR